MVYLSLVLDDALDTDLTRVNQLLDLLDIDKDKVLLFLRDVKRLHVK